MTTLETHVSIAEALTTVTPDGLPFRFTAYDGSATGPEDSPIHMHLASERGLSYVLTAPGDLGMVRAYVMGDLEITGVHPGNPYELMRMMLNKLHFERPTPAEALRIVRGLGWSHLKPPPPPPQEHLPKWRRTFEGLRHSRTRDKAAIHHHYDVSNTFYEWILGPSMTYTCAVYPIAGRHSRAGAGGEVRPGRAQTRSAPGATTSRRRLRLGRHGPARGPRVRRQGPRRHAVVGPGGVGAPRRSNARASRTAPRCASWTTATWPSADFDAISSIGLTEHIGVRNYPSYFGFLLRPAEARRPAAQPQHHPAGQPVPLDRRVHRPLHLPRRRTHRLRPDHRRGPGRRLRGPPRGEPARALRAHPRRLVRQPGRPTGTRRSPRSATPPPRSGASTWPPAGSASNATPPNSTRSWR